MGLCGDDGKVQPLFSSAEGSCQRKAMSSVHDGDESDDSDVLCEIPDDNGDPVIIKDTNE